jgi:hypothetical protein
MTFATWADYLCGHGGATETNKGVDALGDNFLSGEDAPNNLRGEEATLFVGIASDGSPLFVHHLTDLGSNRRSFNPLLMAIIGLHKSTTVVRLAPNDCLSTIPSGDDEDVQAEFAVPNMPKLLAAETPDSFATCKPSWSSRQPPSKPSGRDS